MTGQKEVIVFTLINVEVMTVVLPSLTIIIKFCTVYFFLKFDFYHLKIVIPVRHMTSVSLSKFAMLWIDCKSSSGKGT